MENNYCPVTLRKIALIGNPNSGKSTLFNALTGLHQKTGNFPGVTVDKKTGTAHRRINKQDYEFFYVDLPGTYSLYPKSPDEEVATHVITDEKNPDHPEIVLIVADAMNLKRSLFLAGQIIDMNIPCVLAMNMIDEAEKAGLHIDANRLSNRLGIPVVAVSARDKTGIDVLENILAEEVQEPAFRFIDPSSIAPGAVKILKTENAAMKDYQALHLAHILYERDEKWREKLNAVGFSPSGAQAEESLIRYGVIAQHLEECVGNEKAERPLLTKKIDKWLTHKIWGYVIFIVMMTMVFQSIFYLAKYPMNWITFGFSYLQQWCSAHLPAGILSDLFTNGILAGLSGVVVFVPQIALLFFFIALLEDSGYMARVSFILDKLMRRIGLHGRSVIPLVSGMACAVPAIMSTRTISNWKERIITIMVTPFMSCSARLPVYVLLISLIIPNRIVFGIFQLQGLALMAMYLLGFFTAIISAWVLSLIIRAKGKSWFIMELPVYRMPKWSNVFYVIFEKVKVFLFDAGKVIMAISIVLWVLTSFGPGEEFQKTQTLIDALKQSPPEFPITTTDDPKQLHEFRRAYIVDSAAWSNSIKQEESKKLELSYAGHLGKFIEPAIKPLGYDWKMGVALITSLAAREVFVGTMSTIYGTVDLQTRMKKEKDPVTGKPVYTLATGISLMLFYAFALQCMSTIAVVRRETKSWKWPLIQFTYMGILAYLASLITYQLLK
ncbi:MAG: ferrous iron transport protein B [Bacteroidetes bacterium]|nr:ferrous iron transport protein B [Bacteroidota bacterium]